MLKKSSLALIVVVLIGAVIVYLRFLTPEDSWICENNKWVKHGNPTTEKPKSGCEKTEALVINNKPEPNKLEKTNDPNPSLPETVPTNISITGFYVCLPSKPTIKPQTLECALGLMADNGKYYALDSSAVRTMSDLATGTRLGLSGQFTPLEMLSTDRWQKYNIVGIIRVEKVQETE